MTDFVQGICEDMCPLSEIRLRTKERLLHFFELRNGQKNVPGTLVKSFTRSAAGLKAPKKADLRTVRALQNTIVYLLKDIIIDKRKPYNYVYDFIFDRLRCVRQEIVIQNLNEPITIKLLEPIILFLAYSRYRLCEETIENFDPKICDQHLQECLKKVLCCYDSLDLQKSTRTIKENINRIFIESLYQIFNLGSTESLERSIRLPNEIRKDPVFTLTQNISLQYFRGNYYKTIFLMNKLPHILCAVASLKIQYLRKQLYHHFSHGYSSKQLLVPVEFLRNILFHLTSEDVLGDCRYYNIEIIPNNILSVRFFKNNFNTEKPIMKSKYEPFVEEKLKLIYLPEILLLKKNLISNKF